MSDSTGDFDVSDVLNSPNSPSSTGCEEQRVQSRCLRAGDSEAGLEVGSKAYRIARKRRQNRESATRTRARRVDLTKGLQTQVDELQRTNSQLQCDLRALNLTVASLQLDLDYYRDLALDLKKTS
jgi:hypothetical protein